MNMWVVEVEQGIHTGKVASRRRGVVPCSPCVSVCVHVCHPRSLSSYACSGCGWMDGSLSE